jgi:hypothetical protein
MSLATCTVCASSSPSAYNTGNLVNAHDRVPAPPPRMIITPLSTRLGEEGRVRGAHLHSKAAFVCTDRLRKAKNRGLRSEGLSCTYAEVEDEDV